MNNDVFLVILGGGIATFITRFPLMLLSSKREIPEWLIKYMRFIAPAVLTALIVPAIFTKQGKLDFSISNIYIPAAIITAIVAYFSKNMLISVLTGVCTVGLFMYFFKI